MSIQSEWQVATTNEPAEFDLDYATIKVQAAQKPGATEIQVRLATEFDADWMESQFDEWLADAVDSAIDETAKQAYPHLRRWRDHMKESGNKGLDELAALTDLISAIEQANPGLIRG